LHDDIKQYFMAYALCFSQHCGVIWPKERHVGNVNNNTSRFPFIAMIHYVLSNSQCWIAGDCIFDTRPSS